MTKKARSLSFLFAIFGTLFAASLRANAADLAWSGQYRFEGIKLSNPELNSEKQNKAYMLHHLSLSPKIVAADGVTIYSRLELFNFNSPYENSQLGQVFGSGVGSTAPNSNVLSQNEQSEILTVSQLYMQWAQEYGSLVVGRAPLQFGLGMTHNAGLGQFDHWFDTRDLIGYKMVFGNIFAMPILAKTSEGTLGGENDVNDYILHIQYENPESNLALGVFAEFRFATKTGTDTPVNGSIGGAGATSGNAAGESYKHRLINLFAKQTSGNFKFGIEGGLMSGDAGVKTAGGNGVSINAYGIAGEVGYQKPESRWDFALRAGVASGDDPGTDDVYEGFVFDRNYDVAFIMFNHPLGRADVLRTGAYRDTTSVASALPDVESISNTFYVSPRFNQRMNDRMSWGGNFTWASASQKATANSTSSTDLGFEVDFNFTFKPYERLTWITEAGVLFPGSGWKQEAAGPEGDNKFAYGVTTKAAISF